MLRWLPRVLVLVMLVGLLAMHGVDATATAAHDVEPAHLGRASMDETGGPRHAGTLGAKTAVAVADQSDAIHAGVAATGTGGDGMGLHHVAAACMFVVAAAVAGLRGLLLAIGRTITTAVEDTIATVREGLEDLSHPLRPAWVRHCVIQR